MNGIWEAMRPFVPWLIPIHYRNDKCDFRFITVDEFVKGRSDVRYHYQSEMNFYPNERLPEPTIMVMPPALWPVRAKSLPVVKEPGYQGLILWRIIRTSVASKEVFHPSGRFATWGRRSQLLIHARWRKERRLLQSVGNEIVKGAPCPAIFIWK